MRIPTYDKETVKESGQGIEYVRAGQRSFVGAEGDALTNVGGAIQKNGALAMQFAEQRQKEQDTAAAYNAYYEMTSWNSEVLDGDNGLLRQTGSNAENIAQKYEEMHKEQFSELTKDMSVGAKSLYQRLAARSFSANVGAIGKHEANQRQKYLVETANAAATAASNEYLLNRDEDSLETTVALIDGAVEMSMRGAPPEAKANKKLELISGVHTQVIDGMVDDDPAAAKEYLDEYRDEMTALEIEVAEKKLKTANNINTVQAYANNIDLNGTTQTEALETMRETLPLELQADAAREIKTRYTEKKNAEIENKVANFESVLGVINDGGVPTASQWASLDEKDEYTLKGYLTSMRSGKKVETNFQVWNSITQMPEKDFAKLDLNQYVNSISTTHLQALREDQIALQKGKSFTETSIMAPSADARNYLKNADIDADSDSGIQFIRMAQEEISALEKEQNKKISPSQAKEIYSRLLQEVRLDINWGWNSKVRLFEAGDSQKLEVPDDIRNEIVSALKRAGRPADEDAIQLLYRMKLNK